MKLVSLSDLRSMIASLDGSAKPKEFLRCGDPGMPPIEIPRGALVGVSGPTRTQFVISFLKSNPDQKVLWMESDFKLFPPALEQAGLHLKNFIFVEAAPSLIYPTLQKALRSQVFGTLITGSSPAGDSTHEGASYKSLRLLTQKSNAVLFLLSQTQKKHWPISVLLDAGLDHVSVLRHKSYREGDGGGYESSLSVS